MTKSYRIELLKSKQLIHVSKGNLKINYSNYISINKLCKLISGSTVHAWRECTWTGEVEEAIFQSVQKWYFYFHTSHWLCWERRTSLSSLWMPKLCGARSTSQLETVNNWYYYCQLLYVCTSDFYGSWGIFNFNLMVNIRWE